MLKLNETLQASPKGRVTIGYRSKKTGRFSKIVEKDNLILYGGADIMANLLGGDTRFALSHMYFQYQNTSGSVTASSSFTRADGVEDFNAISGTGLNPIDWLRIPILTSGKISAFPEGDDSYSGNSITFVATSAAHPTQLGESPEENYFSDDGVNGPSKIYAVALAAAPQRNNKLTDVVFSRLALDVPITVQPDNYIDCFWTIAFR